MWGVLPIKEFNKAKSRLRCALLQAQRVELARAMAIDVLSTLAAVPAIEGVLIVSDEPGVTSIAAPVAAHILSGTERLERGHSNSVRNAVDYLADRSVKDIAILPSDTPLVSLTDIETLIAAYEDLPDDRRAVFCSNRDGTGTNAILLSLPAEFAFSYGPDSLLRHIAAARSIGLAVRRVSVLSLELDIDTPEDLTELTRRLRDCPRDRARHTRAALAELDLPSEVSNHAVLER